MTAWQLRQAFIDKYKWTLKVDSVVFLRPLFTRIHIFPQFLPDIMNQKNRGISGDGKAKEREVLESFDFAGYIEKILSTMPFFHAMDPVPLRIVFAQQTFIEVDGPRPDTLATYVELDSLFSFLTDHRGVSDESPHSWLILHVFKWNRTKYRSVSKHGPAHYAFSIDSLIICDSYLHGELLRGAITYCTIHYVCR